MNLQGNVNQLVHQAADIKAKKTMANKMSQTPKTPAEPKFTQSQVDYIIQQRDIASDRVRKQVMNADKQRQAMKTRISNLKKKVATLEGGKA